MIGSRFPKIFGCLLVYVVAHSWLGATSAGHTPLTPPKQRPSTNSALTPLQRQIENQRLRLASAEIEERRDALVRLGNLGRAESSRVALGALNDPSAIVRATAAHAVLSLSANEAIAALAPLLNDKSEFVRQEVAYALGQTRSRSAIQPLIASLSNDKQASVRAAAAVALGQIGDASAVASLAGMLGHSSSTEKSAKKKRVKRENEFVLRAAARALGQIGSPAGVPILIEALSDENNVADLRREAAYALGLIGDRSAEPALGTVLTARDPYLSRISHEALLRIQRRATPLM